MRPPPPAELGTIATVEDMGTAVYSGDGGKAVDKQLESPTGLAASVASEEWTRPI